MFNRSERRHHIERLKKNRKIHWGRKLNKAELGLVVNTPTPCSCPACGNPRRHFGKKTIQERKVEQEYK
jgi:hypothetical protein